MNDRTPSRTAGLSAGPQGGEPLAEGGMLAGVLVVLVLVQNFQPVPGLSAALTWVEPLPVVIAFLRRGARCAWLTLVAAGVFLLLFLGPVAGTLAAARVGSLGLVLGWARRRRLAFAVEALAAAAATLLGIGLSFAAARLFYGNNASLRRLYRVFDRVLAWLPYVYRRLGVPAATQHQVGQLLRLVRHLLPLLLLLLLVVLVLVYGAVAAWVNRLALSRLGPALPPVGGDAR